MRPETKAILKATVLFCLILGAGTTYRATHAKGATTNWVLEQQFSPYAPQRVIYHVDQSAGLMNGHFKHILQTAQNHINAVGADKLDLRIVLQGDGVDLLSWAKDNKSAQEQIDRLKAQGVKFLICRNSLILRGVDPDQTLYDVHRTDLIRSAVGDIAALEQQGFQYLKP